MSALSYLTGGTGLIGPGCGGSPGCGGIGCGGMGCGGTGCGSCRNMAATPSASERRHASDGSEMEGLAALSYAFRWNRHGRKGQPCAVTARSKA